LDMRARVSRNGRVRIPKRLRERLGIRPGQILDFEEEKGRLIARKIVEGRWVIETRHARRPWEVIVEPDPERESLVVVTAHAVWESRDE